MLELCESKLAELRLVGLEQVRVAAIGHWGSVIMIPQYVFLSRFEHDGHGTTCEQPIERIASRGLRRLQIMSAGIGNNVLQIS